jgi:hypothetical protein
LFTHLGRGDLGMSFEPMRSEYVLVSVVRAALNV